MAAAAVAEATIATNPSKRSAAALATATAPAAAAETPAAANDLLPNAPHPSVELVASSQSTAYSDGGAVLKRARRANVRFDDL